MRVPSGGGPPETVAGENGPANPQVLPGGNAVLFSARGGRGIDARNIEVITLADRHRKIVAHGGNTPRYLPTSNGSTGHLVYVNKATLFAIPFDPDKLETHGTAVPILNDVASTFSNGAGQFDFSSEPSGHGTLVYRRDTGDASAKMTLQWVDSAGKREPLLAKSGVSSNPTLSPDGKRVALSVGEREIMIFGSTTSGATP